MPTYEYTCTACGEHLEVVQSFRDDPLTECPACDGRLRKVFGSIGVVFKGRGFYKTDSRPAASPSGASGTDSKSAEKSASPGKGGAESPAAAGSSGASSDSGAKEKKQSSAVSSSAGKSAAAS